MNIRYANGRFEAEFQDFSGDYAAVKAAGWKYDGDSTTWYTKRVAAVVCLRERHRPASGLTITPDARGAFAALLKNEEIKKQAEKAKKEARKEREHDGGTCALKIPEKGYIDKSDLPESTMVYTTFVPPEPPAARCVNCKDPVYLYETHEPYAICLWCEKIVVDIGEGF